MSIVAMKFAVSVRGVHPSCKSVMLILAWHHNAQTGICNPSQKTISEETCLSEKQVSRCIKTLCDVGAISIISVGKCQRKSYKINIPEAILSGSFEIPETDTVSGYMDMVSGSNGGRKEPVSDTVSSSFGHGVFSVSDTVSDSYIGRKNIDKSVIERKTPQTPHGGQDCDFFAPAVIEPLEAEVVQTVPAKRVKAKPQPVEIDPRFYALGEIMAEARQVCTGVQPRKSATKFYGEMFAKMVASDKADPKEIQTVVFWLLGGSKLAVEAFGFGLGNTPKKYEHAFSRNFASLYEKATRETRKPPQDPETPQMLDADEMLERLQSF